jgi:hypothetical protein
MLGQQKLGPVGFSAILAMIQTGAIAASTMVWREGMVAWVPAGGVPELAFSFGSAGSKKEGALGLTTPGLIVFIILLVVCIPLCWLPWVIKDLRVRP